MRALLLAAAAALAPATAPAGTAAALAVPSAPAAPGQEAGSTAPAAPAPRAAEAAPSAPDTLELGRLHEAAVRHDARAHQGELLRSSLELRLGNLTAEWLPRLRLRGEARRQSDVPRVEAAAPATGGGAEGGAADVDGDPAGAAGTPVFPEVPRERIEAALGVEQTLYDASIGARRDVARARTDEERAHLEGTLYELRRDVDAAFFAALTAEARHAETRLLLEDLEARLERARSAVRAGVRLRGDAAKLEAEALRAGQRLEAREADRRAALTVLSNLTGLTLDERDVLASPDLEALTAEIRGRAARAAPDGEAALRHHPLFAAFDRTEERLAREAFLTRRARHPRLVAFGEAGYGRPGLNQFGDTWDAFWLGGVRLEWAPWTWGRVDREARLLEVRGEVVDTEREAFAAALARAAADRAAEIDWLEAALASDARIVRLLEGVERQETRRFEEGVITAADYVRARTDLGRARVGERLHRIELAAARAAYLTILGVQVP